VLCYTVVTLELDLRAFAMQVQFWHVAWI